MNKFYGFCFKVFLLITFLNNVVSDAQVIELGTGSTYTGSNYYGPANTSTTGGAASRYAYIFPQSTVNSLIHGDSIVSLDFYRNGGDSLTGTCNLKIYIRLGPNSNYGAKNINWVNLTGATGMKKVYDKNPKTDFGKTNGWVRLNLTNVYIADTTFGKNLEMLIEYTQSSAQSSNILWSYESRFTVNGYNTNQCKFTRTNGGVLQDTTNVSTEVHPSIKINFPRYNQDASVMKVYALGKLPIPLGNPDTIKAIVKNIGKQSFSNQKIYVISKGKNKIIDSLNITLKYLEERLVRMPILYPTNLGLDTLIVRIAKDQNNSRNESETYRVVTEYTYSYKDPTQPLAGGIGFNGSTGDFVAKFYSNNAKAINQINVSFSGPSQKFKLGIWKANGKGGGPGINVWTSDTLTSAPNFITPVLPSVSVNGSFYVGVRQISTTNVGFGYQDEDPVRTGTFYYAAPYGDTNWVDFAPDAPYKFAIEPRIQANHDMAPISFDFPKDTLNLVTVKTMAPKATIINYGAKNELTPFNVTMEIRRYGSLVYSSTKQDTLSSVRKHKITFDSTFLPLQPGNYDVTIITKLGSDQMKDNDTLKKTILLSNFRDVGIASIFDPIDYIDYLQFIDSVYPIATIQNFGLDRVLPFNVTCQILDSANKILYTDTQLSDTIESGSSSIMVFKSYFCTTRGKLKFRIFTRLSNDTRRKNDTMTVFFNVVRVNDVAVTKGIYPPQNKTIAPPAVPKFVNLEMENLGDLNQPDPFLTYCKIYYQNSLVYTDSQSFTAYNGITTNMFFKKFLPVIKGYYTLVCYSDLPNDQVRKNDTLRFSFAYGLPDDIEPFNPIPVANSKLDLARVYAPKISVRNNGSNSQKTPFEVVFMVNKGTTNIYTSLKTMTLDSGKTKSITFDSSLSLADTGIYHFVVYTGLGKDFDKSNDTIKGIYRGVSYYDVGVFSISYPTLTDTLMVNKPDIYPEVVIRNFGDSIVKSRFSTTVSIFNKTTNALLYRQSKDTSFSSKTPLFITFPKVGKIANPQNIVVRAQTNFISDQYRKNDSAFSESQYEIWYDAVSQSIALPLNAGIYKTNSPLLKPVVSVKNGGKKTIDYTKYLFSIKKVDTTSSIETTVYKDSLEVLNLAVNLTNTLTYATDFDFALQTAGVYKCYLDALYAADQDDNNNHLQSGFRILDASGVKIIEFSQIAVYPNPASHSLMITVPENINPIMTLNIFDMNGRNVMKRDLTTYQSMIDISQLTNGIYYLEVNNNRIKLEVNH